MKKRRRFYKTSPPRKHCPSRTIAMLRWARNHPLGPIPVEVAKRIVETKNWNIKYCDDRIIFIRKRQNE